jgi:hypothetical protein
VVGVVVGDVFNVNKLRSTEIEQQDNNASVIFMLEKILHIKK